MWVKPLKLLETILLLIRIQTLKRKMQCFPWCLMKQLFLSRGAKQVYIAADSFVGKKVEIFNAFKVILSVLFSCLKG